MKKILSVAIVGITILSGRATALQTRYNRPIHIKPIRVDKEYFEKISDVQEKIRSHKHFMTMARYTQEGYALAKEKLKKYEDELKSLQKQLRRF